MPNTISWTTHNIYQVLPLSADLRYGDEDSISPSTLIFAAILVLVLGHILSTGSE